ncbi:hypothetical protein [Amaricoccus sp.]|uniref:hypothetical protein n=1 Tax=Amaricoccus sp. TaxID=1872485 RepID=UPI001B6872AF|nr:hypothetical protein [Amaricoccus sp.]MBP7242119.1 hypothetical protein [Amaricoccus sp.]
MPDAALPAADRPQRHARRARGPRRAWELVEALPPEGGAGADLVYRRRELRDRAQPLLVARDAADVFVATSMAALARAAGPAAWAAWCRRLAASPIRRMHEDAARLRAGLAVVGLPLTGPAHAAIDRARAGYFRRQMLTAAEGAGRLDIGIDFAAADLARLRAALDRGRGTILWVDDTFCGQLVSKRALAEADLPPAHVSSALHGVSLSRFGVAWLNPPVIRAENRHLGERLVFAGGETAEVMRRILRILRGGGVVTMTNSVFSGGGFVETPFGDGGWLSLATGAPGLALRHGAALFPLAAVEVEPFRRYRIVLGAEVEGAGRDGSNAALAAVARRVAGEMRERVRAWPDQYPGLLGGRFTATRFPDLRA